MSYKQEKLDGAKLGIKSKNGRRKKYRRGGHKIQRRIAKLNPNSFDTYKQHHGWEA